jgi:WD40 repeat protein
MHRLLVPTALLTLCFLSACGGGSAGSGGSTGGSNPPPSPDFTLSVSPQSILLAPGTSGSLSISIQAVNGFTGQVEISISGVPSEVTPSTTRLVVSAGGQAPVQFSAPNAATYVTATVSVSGVSGALIHGVQVPLAVALPATSTHAPTRTRYIRTDSFYDSNDLQFAPPHFTVYDARDKRFFVSNPYLNRIDVFDSQQEIAIAQIVVPGAWGIDISPDDTKLFAGSLVGDIFQIDPATMQVVARTPSASIGPSGFTASEVFVLANGSLALLGAPGGLPEDGYQNFAIWNPASNALTVVNSPVATPAGCSIQNIGAFGVTGDRTKILAASIDSDETVCSFDAISLQGTAAPAGSSGDFVNLVIPTPDGKRFFVTSEDGTVVVFDASTVAKLGTFQGPMLNTSPPSSLGIYGATISLDGSTLYVVDLIADLVAYDTTALTEKGWVPNYSVVDLQQWIVPSAVDETGLIVGPTGHGVAFADGSQIQPGVTSPQIGLGPLTPLTGPASGGTTLQVIVGSGVQNLNDFPALSQAYVGNAQLVDASAVSSMPNNFPTITGTTPPSSTGTIADFTAVYSNNNVAMMPESFSYGPSFVEVVSDAATAEGGATGAIVGYGFEQSPSDLQVTVGGKSAPVTTLNTSAPYIPYPYPVEVVQFTVPAGTAGPADITLTTANGSTTAAGAFHYAPAANSYPLPGSNLQAGIYDPHRNVYYFADMSKIQVLSLTSGGWQTPITLPGVGNSTQLLALSLSPDGTRLAVSDFGDKVIYVLNPASPASAQSFSLPQGPFDLGTAPSGLAVLDSGVVYFATIDTDGTGDYAFHKLDTTSGTFTDFTQVTDGGTNDAFIRVLLSPDGLVYSQIEGIVFYLDPTNDTITFATTINSNSGGNNELALSADGSTLVTNGFFADANLNATGLQVYTDRETWLPVATIGQKLDMDGSVLFQPLTNGIDVVDVQTGRLVNRIQLSVQLPTVHDSLVVDGTDDIVVAITTTGVAAIDLTSETPTSAARERVGRAAVLPGPSVQSGAHAAPRVPSQLILDRPRLKQSKTQPLNECGWPVQNSCKLIR